MADHHEPAAVVTIPSPSSAFVPSSQSAHSSNAKAASLTNEPFQKIPDIVKITVPSPLQVEVHPGKNHSSTSTACETPTTTAQAKDTSSLTQPLPKSSPSDTSDVENKLPNNETVHISALVTKEPLGCIPMSSSSLPTTHPTIISQPSLSSVANVGIIQNVITHPVDSLLPHVLTPSLPTSTAKLINSLSSSSTPPSFLTPSTGFKTGVVPRNILKPAAIVPNVNQPYSSSTNQQIKPTIDPVPSVIPEFQTGKIDAKRFPARHFDLKTLVIGSWKYEAKSGGFLVAPKTSRLKVIFSQKKFIYEFELGDNPGMMLMYQKEKRMASIEVPFSTVVGLNIPKENPHQLLIEVNSPPTTYLGKQELHSSATGCALPTKYDTMNPVDLTDGQILTIPYHQINLCSTYLRGRLEEFDPRFKAMLRTPIVMEPNKKLPQQPIVKPVKHKNNKDHGASSAPKRSRKPSSASSSSGNEGTCACTSGCNSQRCKCVKTNGKCSSECKCVSCKNPLNILANNGVDVAVAKQDKCLMQNIFRINDLDKLLKEGKERIPCCEVLMPLKDICVGLIECPECESEYRFSWCGFYLCDDECRPRNHCDICRRCGDYRDDHCFKCNKCYFAGSAGSFRCPCEDRLSFIDSLSMFLNNFVDPGDSSDDEYY